MKKLGLMFRDFLGAQPVIEGALPRQRGKPSRRKMERLAVLCKQTAPRSKWRPHQAAREMARRAA